MNRWPFYDLSAAIGRVEMLIKWCCFFMVTNPIFGKPHFCSSTNMGIGSCYLICHSVEEGFKEEFIGIGRRMIVPDFERQLRANIPPSGPSKQHNSGGNRKIWP